MRRLVAVAVFVAAACGQDPYSAPAKNAAPASAAPAPAAPVAAAPSEPAKPPIVGPNGEDLTLSAEEERLIAADITTLGPEERRKRAFAQRKRILQNPDSPTAKTLEDLRRATENGELEPPTRPEPERKAELKFEAKTAPNP